MARQRALSPTPVQERILKLVREAIRDTGEPPTLEEIGQAIGGRSRSTVHYHLAALEEKGAIIRDRHRSRGIRLS
jgi:repressor LexA